MIEVTPYARLLGVNLPSDLFTIEDGVRLLRRIEYFGRFSHASEEAQTNDSWQRFIQAVVVQHGDWSIVEHASVTVDFLVDRGISHELVRHRLFSFTQSSTRFINYTKKMDPKFVRPNFGNQHASAWADEANQIWEDAVYACESAYRSLLGKGVPPQLARSVFPNALSTRLAVTGNLRNWRHHFIMRTTRETHPQYLEVMVPLLEQFKESIPLLFDDIEAGVKQSEGMKKAR